MADDEHERLTLITGADKGIGFQTASALVQRGQHVLIGARSLAKATAAKDQIAKQGGKVDVVLLDVTDSATIEKAAHQVADQFRWLDTLINNAGIALDNHEPASKLSTDLMRREFDVNFFGAVQMIQAFLPLLRRSNQAQIINVSSNMGSLGLAADPKSRFYAVNSLGYQASKAALNFATISLAKELRSAGILVNSVNPGWTATEFGGRDLSQPTPQGMQTVEKGAKQIIKLAADWDDTRNMTFTEDGGTLPW